MSDIDQGLRALTEKARAILKKKNSGKPLSASEQSVLDAAVGRVASNSGSAQAPPRKSSSIAAAVADLKAQGIDVTRDFLRELKREGGTSAGFESSNRVNLDLLVPYLRNRIASAAAAPGAPRSLNKTTLECEKLLEQIEDLREARAIRQGKFVERIQVVSSNRVVGAKLKDILKKLINEMPAAVAGKDIPEARLYGGQLYDQAMRTISDWSDDWPE